MPAVGRSINTVADDILKLQTRRKKLEEQAGVIEAQEKDLKKELQELAEKSNLTFGGNKKSAWKLTPQVVPQATNWDEFYEYLHENKYYHLLQRRPAVKACQELWEQKIEIPGIEKFKSTRIDVKEV
jgi:predicted nuclease with TOPRIM domain